MLVGDTTPRLAILVRIDGILAGTPKSGTDNAPEQIGFFCLIWGIRRSIFKTCRLLQNA